MTALTAIEPAAPQEAAADAGLHYATDDAPGLRRTRRGKGFSYIDAQGRLVSLAERNRIKALVIPPAWQGVGPG